MNNGEELKMTIKKDNIKIYLKIKNGEEN